MTWLYTPTRPCPVCTLDMVHEHEGVIIDGTVIVRECQRPNRRWPLAPLLEQVGSGAHTALVKRAGVSGRDVRRAAELGLSDVQADHWAIRCRLHPALVWPGWAAAALTPLDDQFINGGGWRPAYLHMEDSMTRGPQKPTTDAHIAADGTVASRCWCDTRTVRVTPADVRAGRTKSCGATDPLDGHPTCTPTPVIRPTWTTKAG